MTPIDASTLARHAGGELAASGGHLDDAVGLGLGEAAQRSVEGLAGRDVDGGVGEALVLGAVEHLAVDLWRCDGHTCSFVADPSSGDVWIGTARGLARLAAFVDAVEPVFGPPPFRVDRLLLDPRDGTVWAEIGGMWWLGRNGSPALERSGETPPLGALVGPAPVDEVDAAALPWIDPLWVDSELLFGARFRLTVLDRDRRGDWYVGTWGDNGRRWAEARSPA